MLSTFLHDFYYSKIYQSHAHCETHLGIFPVENFDKNIYWLTSATGDLPLDQWKHVTKPTLKFISKLITTFLVQYCKFGFIDAKFTNFGLF